MLPSWVPDWSVNPNIIPIGLRRDFQEPYNAIGYPAVTAVTGDRLITKGVLLDTVGWIGSSYDAADSSSAYEQLTLDGQLTLNESSISNKLLDLTKELFGKSQGHGSTEQPTVTNTARQWL